MKTSKYFRCRNIERWIKLCICLCILISCKEKTSKIKGTTCADNSRPNIIFILTDDQRWDALGYVSNRVITPEMDRLAREGTYFSHAIATTPICAASRASIFTGQQERTHGYTFGKPALDSSTIDHVYASQLKKNGYHTGYFGKLGVKIDQPNRLFETADFYDRNTDKKNKEGYFYKTLEKDTVHLTRYTGEQGLNFIKNAPKDRPFCLTLSFSAPHAHDPSEQQYFWQEDQESFYKDQTMELPKLAKLKYYDSLPQVVKEGFNRKRWEWRFNTPEKYQQSVKGYYRMIKGIDNELGRIRNLLAFRGLDENTIIILMGDNGCYLGERQLAGKWLMHDNSIRVPLIIYSPGYDHKEIDDMVLNLDVPSTILDISEVERPSSYQGKSLMPYVKGENKDVRKMVLIEHLWDFDKIPASEGIRTSKYKYFRYIGIENSEELYNLEKDPEETINLAQKRDEHKKLIELREACDSMIHLYSKGNTNEL